MNQFRVALTGDFLHEKAGNPSVDIGLGLLDAEPKITYRFIDDHAPKAKDPGWFSRLYSLEVKPEHIAAVDGLVVLRPWVKRSTFSGGPGSLTVIGRSGAGYDKIDIDSCTENDVAVFNCPLELNHSTASTALLFILALSKRLMSQDRITRQGRWDLQPATMGAELEGRTLGIIGLGHSGRELVRLVQPFNMKVMAHSPHADARQAASLGVRLVSLEEVLQSSDFVSLHCRLTPQTRRMIGRSQLALMKPRAYVVNIARGELIDQPALVDALDRRAIAGAALDVFEVEPLPKDDPLTKLDNVILTPHYSPATVDIWAATGRATSTGMIRAAHGRVPPNIVNPAVLDRPGFRAKLARFTEKSETALARSS
jgi:phosphoglycerate dehydrogenase-like enzyme